MRRKIESIKSHVEPVAADGEPDVAAWLLHQGQRLGLETLLAFADDGVIWGQVRKKRLHAAHEHFPEVSPELRVETLQEARLFGPDGEIYLWRVDGGWEARAVLDGGEEGRDTDFFDEWPMLWGTRAEAAAKGFTLVADGAQGLRHAPPIEIKGSLFEPLEGEALHRPLRLHVRHYVRTDPDSGLMSVYLSRLVAVLTEEEVTQ